MMMTNNIKYALSFVKSHFHRFAFLFCLVLLLLLPHISSAVTLYTIGESYSDDTYLGYCSREHFEAKYNSETRCWPCDVVDALMSGLSRAINLLIAPVNELAKIILLLGAAIWLAVYFLKTVSSMATQDPAKSLDGALTFMFKAAFIYVLVDGGLANIIAWIVAPLLSIGMDVSHDLALMTME